MCHGHLAFLGVRLTYQRTPVSPTSWYLPIWAMRDPVVIRSASPVQGPKKDRAKWQVYRLTKESKLSTLRHLSVTTRETEATSHGSRHH